MSRKKLRAPQEKKALSYAKDRRNSYGQNDKASRRLIPLRKAQDHRSQRRVASQSLAFLTNLPEEAAARVESDVKRNVTRARAWKKSPDMPLADFVAGGLKARAARAGRPRRAFFVSTPAIAELTARLDEISAQTGLSARQRQLARSRAFRDFRRPEAHVESTLPDPYRTDEQ